MIIKIEIKPGTAKRILTIAGGLALIAGLVAVANAVPVTFTNGSVLTADQLNSNFSDLEDRVAALEGSQPVVQTGVVTGTFTDGTWTLNTGSGGRTATYHVTFTTPFAAAPQVIASLAYVEEPVSTDIRLGLSVTNITTTGFDLGFGTYSNTLVNAASASWLAVAP